MTGSKRRFLVLGGGLAGLTCTDELLSRGHEVVCIEANIEVGGLARNLVFHDHIFDIGGHRFHTTNPVVLEWIKNLMGDELLRVKRKSRILLRGRFADYPLRPLNAFFGMGPVMTAKIVAGYLSVARRGQAEHDNFEDWVVARFGRALYDIYFGPYTRKVWGVDPRKISATWAAQRIQLLSLAEAVKKAVLPGGDSPRTYVSHFWYPRRGIGRISARLAERVAENGGEVRKGAPVTSITRESGRFRVTTSAGDTVEGDAVISTIPINHTAEMLGYAIPEGTLEYRCLRCVLIVLDQERVSDDTWVYTPDADTIFGRIHEPKNWSSDLVPGNGTSLCLELFCTEGDEIWKMSSEDLGARCAADLERLGFIRPGAVRAFRDVRVKYAYPVFLVGYEQKLAQVIARIQEQGVSLVGRTGAFTYKNMDQVVEDALALVTALDGR